MSRLLDAVIRVTTLCIIAFVTYEYVFLWRWSP